MVCIMSLFAPTTVTDDRILLTNRAPAQNDIRARLGPIGFEVARSVNPLPDPMGCVSLLPWCLLIGLQNLIYERDCRRQFPPRSLHFLPRHWQAANRLTHHTPMDVQLLGDAGYGCDAKLVFSADLLEKLHFCSPLQRVPPLWAIARLKSTRSSGVGQIKLPKWANPFGIPKSTRRLQGR
jgi:hypothetical protein